MLGDLKTNNVKAKDSDGVKIYNDAGTVGFTVDDDAYIKAYTGESINEFSIDGTLAGDSDLALPTEKAVKTYVDTTVTNLTLGTMSIQNANAVAITGGTVVGITDLAIADGGTAASTAADARTNLGLGTISTQDANAVAIIGGAVTGITDITVADGGTGASTAADARTNLGLGTISTQDANAVAITGGSVVGITDLAIADGGTAASTAAGARTNLGLGTISTQDANAVAITGGAVTGITDLVVADGGTGASTAADARTNLGLTGSSNTTHYHDGRYYTETELTNGATTLVLGRLKIDNATRAAGYLYDSTTDPVSTTRLNYDGYFYATRVYNAVYNDIADFQTLDDELVYGKCYYDTNYGAKICDKRCQKGIMGIASDTFGQSCGIDSTKEQVSISIAGWVLAYVDKEYEIGTPLTNDDNGNLTEISREEKLYFPERIIATYKKKERKVLWNGVVVDNRDWVKIN